MGNEYQMELTTKYKTKKKIQNINDLYDMCNNIIDTDHDPVRLYKKDNKRNEKIKRKTTTTFTTKHIQIQTKYLGNIQHSKI